MRQAFSHQRVDRFCGIPLEAARLGNSWVVNGTNDPCVESGELYAFKESVDFSTLINRAFLELNRFPLENSGSAFHVFNEYFIKMKQSEKEPEFFHTLNAALMLYTDQRFFRILNDAWRNNRSRELFAFSVLMIMAFEHAPYFIEGEVYRGVTLEDINHYQPGMIFRWPFFVSASTKKQVAENFGRTLFVIEVPSDGNVREIHHSSLFPEEGEVLFHPYEVFEVMEAGKDQVRIRISSDILFGVEGVEETSPGMYEYSPIKSSGTTPGHDLVKIPGRIVWDFQNILISLVIAIICILILVFK